MSRTWKRIGATLLVALGLALPAAAATTTTVIVQLGSDPGAVYKAKRAQAGQSTSDDQLAAYRAQLTVEQNDVLARIAGAGIAAQVLQTQVPGYAGGVAGTIAHRWTLVLNGFALNVDIRDVARLSSVAGIEKVARARELQPNLDKSVKFVRASELYGGVHELTQFDDLREGYEGQGTIISVIDTGVEWQHEMFGGDPTPPRLGVLPASAAVPANPKVIYYLPLADIAVEDAFGHGTHVASTAAGYLGFAAGADGVPLNSDDVPLHGVAPQAKLMSYLVCSNIGVPAALTGTGPGGCLNVLTITAIEDSVSPRTQTGFAKPVAHVINLSLGGKFGTPDDDTATAASNAALLGTVVVAAAGNSGDVAGIVGSPSTGRRVISVANATDPGSGAEWFADVLAASAISPAVPGAVTPAKQLPLAAGQRSGITIYPMAGTAAPPADALAQYYVYVDSPLTFADFPPAVAGRIALANAGGATGVFAESANNAALAGAVALLLIGTTQNATAVNAPIPAAMIDPADAQYLLDLIGPAPANGAVSPLPIRISPNPAAFRADVAGSSSRGPVAGFRQIKPDLSAPGTNVLAAIPPASVIGAVDNTDQGPAYATISGTSMASPHVAGAAALVKQANPTWSPDEIRTALINASTPMRDSANAADSYGPHNPKIHSQGGGYVDVKRAASASALMGVAGDGVIEPTILGSHAFGEVPAINCQCTHLESVQVDIVDKRGRAGSYDLAVYDNRNGATPGVQLALSRTRVDVPANGRASFSAGLSFDGSAIEDESLVEVQWFLVARRTDGGETLSMPLYLRAVPSVPAASGEPQVVTETYHGTLGLGSTDAEVGEQYQDVEVEVAPGTFRLQGLLEGDMVTNVAYPDLDLQLFDPNGVQIGNSGNPGSVESVDVAVSMGGTYVFRIVNYLNHGSSYTLTVTKHQLGGAQPATAAQPAGEYIDGAGQTIDFNGSFTVSWSGHGGETGYTVERRVDGGAWQTLQTTSASTTSVALTSQPNGLHEFRVLASFPGRICTFVAAPSNVVAIRVDRRSPVTITGSTQTAITRIASFAGVWEVDIALTNGAAQSYLAPLALEIVAIHAATSSISVINADNGGNGRSTATAARFDYSGLVGDEVFAAGETSGVRTVRFANPSGQLFTLGVAVKAHRRP